MTDVMPAGAVTQIAPQPPASGHVVVYRRETDDVVHGQIGRTAGDALRIAQEAREYVGASLAGTADAATSALVQDSASATRAALDSRYAQQGAYRAEPELSHLLPTRVRDRVSVPSSLPLAEGMVAFPYFTGVLDTAGHPGDWLDRFYLYCAAHDSAAVWLYTAPAEDGPWTRRHMVAYTTGDTAWAPTPSPETATAVDVSPLIKEHVSSPEAVWAGSEIRLYVHGMRTLTTTTWSLEQPTILLTSTDGVAFTVAGEVLDAPHDEGDTLSHAAMTRSYARVFRVDSGWGAVYQANNPHLSGTAGGPLSQVVHVGLSRSLDGVRWAHQRPLLSNESGGLGLYAATCFRHREMWWLIGQWRQGDGSAVGRVYAATDLEPGAFRHVGDLPPVIGPSGALATTFAAPCVLVQRDRVLLFYGAMSAAAPAHLRVCELEWR